MGFQMWPDQLGTGRRRRYVDVAEALADAIGAGRFDPGGKLPSDREIASRLGVSRPTAREGLLALEYAGLIEIRPGSGAYVAEPRFGPGAMALSAVESPQDLIRARAVVEPAIARLAATNATPDELRGMRALVDKARLEVGPSGSPTELVRLGLEFHRLLAGSCHNPLLASFCISLVSVGDHPLWTLLNRQAMRTSEARLKQVDEHAQIIGAMESGDAEAAFEAMSSHLEHVSIEVASVV